MTISLLKCLLFENLEKKKYIHLDLSKNKLMSCSLKDVKDLKEGRGAIDAKVSKEEDICFARWYENFAVLL